MQIPSGPKVLRFFRLGEELHGKSHEKPSSGVGGCEEAATKTGTAFEDAAPASAPAPVSAPAPTKARTSFISPHPSSVHWWTRHGAPPPQDIFQGSDAGMGGVWERGKRV
ncbi:hypothetical protein ANO11243_086460 [Dothideomycetidae sp. 11243]|nr:hypothetical protein ANO11243_086460 [fungal sp. No.11243]